MMPPLWTKLVLYGVEWTKRCRGEGWCTLWSGTGLASPMDMGMDMERSAKSMAMMAASCIVGGEGERERGVLAVVLGRLSGVLVSSSSGCCKLMLQEGHKRGDQVAAKPGFSRAGGMS